MANGIQILLLCILYAIAVITDLKARIIPHSSCIGIALTTLIDFTPHKLWGVLLALPFLIPMLLSKEEEPVGGGDMKLFAAIGVALGFWHGVHALILGFIPLIPVFIYTTYRKKKLAVPLAPFICFGSLLTILLTNQVTGVL